MEECFSYDCPGKRRPCAAPWATCVAIAAAAAAVVAAAVGKIVAAVAAAVPHSPSSFRSLAMATNLPRNCDENSKVEHWYPDAGNCTGEKGTWKMHLGGGKKMRTYRSEQLLPLSSLLLLKRNASGHDIHELWSTELCVRIMGALPRLTTGEGSSIDSFGVPALLMAGL